MYGGRLTRDLGESVPETWRRAILQLSDHEVRRGLARLLKGGHSGAPSLPQFVKACKLIGEDDGPSAPTGLRALAAPSTGDMYDGFGNKALLGWLMTNGAATAESLAVMIAVKNDIVKLYRDIGAHDKVEPSELKDQLLTAFRKIFEPMGHEEAEHVREAYCNDPKVMITFEPMSRDELQRRSS